MTYKSPNNATEYWQVVDNHWDDLFHILNVYLPTYGKEYIDKSALSKTLGEYILELKETHNPRLCRIFNAALWNIPDTVPNNEIPSWAQFYDLCVMDYRIYEHMEIEE